MKRPAVFFDRDNTLIACDGYLGDPAKVVLIEGAAEAVARVRSLGFAAVVFSNQSGVARGMFPEEAVHAVNHRLDDLLHEDNPQAVIDRHDFCPYHPNAKVERYRLDSDLRKPNPGMIYQAAGKLNLDLDRSWVVGDAPRDIAAGKAAGLRTVLLKIASLPPSPATSEGSGVEPDFVAESMQEAIDFIEHHMEVRREADEVQQSAFSDGSQQNTDAWTSPAGAAETVVSASNGSISEEVPASSSSSSESGDQVEEPVKITPRPNQPEPGKPTVIKPQSAKAEPVAKPVQGGFVVKPTQAPPAGMTWAERIRLAKQQGGAVSTPVTPRPEPKPAAPPPPIVEPEPEPVVAEPEEVLENVVRKPDPEPAEAEATPEPESSHERSMTTELRADQEEQSAHAEAPAEEAETLVEQRAVEAPREETPHVAETADEPTVIDPVRVIPADVMDAEAEDARPEPPATPPRRGYRREDAIEAEEASPVQEMVEDRPAVRSRRQSTGDPSAPASVGDLRRVEELLEQLLMEARRREDHMPDFSVSKLLAGITQVLSLASLVYAYINKDSAIWLMPTLLLALTLQTLTISLLIMGRQK